MAEEALYFVNNTIYRDILPFKASADGISTGGFPVGYFISICSTAGSEHVSDNIFEDLLIVGWSFAGSGAAVPGLDGGIIVYGPNVLEIFKIRPLSPCVNAGVNAATDMYGNVYDDFYGTMRPRGGTYDIGAHESNVASFSPVITQPLARTQLAFVLSLWEELLSMLPEEPTDEMAALIEEIQEPVANAAQLTNPIYASGQLSKAAELMQQLAALLA